MKQIKSSLVYLDWITIECAYEYFRRHMRKEWKRVVGPELRKCRKVKTRNKRRRELSEIFFSNYVIASNLYKPEELKKMEPGSEKEMRDRIKLEAVEGGKYN